MQGFTKDIPIDNDGTLSANSDFIVPSQKAVKTYADTKEPLLGFTPEDVANNHQFLADFLTIGSEKTGGGSSPKVRFKGWVFSDVSNAKYLVFNSLMDTTVENSQQITPSQPFIVGEKSILYFEATTDTNDTFVSCRFSGVLIRDVDA